MKRFPLDIVAIVVLYFGLFLALTCSGCSPLPFAGGGSHNPPPPKPTLAHQTAQVAFASTAALSVAGIVTAVVLLIWGRASKINPLTLLLCSILTLGLSLVLAQYERLITIAAGLSLLGAV